MNVALFLLLMYLWWGFTALTGIEWSPLGIVSTASNLWTLAKCVVWMLTASLC